jgi:hypothetical protein
MAHDVLEAIADYAGWLETKTATQLSRPTDQKVDAVNMVDESHIHLVGATPRRSARPLSTWMMRSAAASLVIAGLGGTYWYATRDAGIPPAADQGTVPVTAQPFSPATLVFETGPIPAPVLPPTAVAEPDPLLQLVPDALPDGLKLTSAELHPPGESNPNDWQTRLYATTSSTPETGPALIVTSLTPEMFNSNIANQDAEQVTVQGGPARIADNGSTSTLIAHPNPETTFVIVGYRIDRAQLIAAAEAATLSTDNFGVSIATDALPVGVTEQGAGLETLLTLVPTGSASLGWSSVTWSLDSRLLTLIVSNQQSSALALGRIKAGQVTETSVNGNSGYSASYFGSETLTWSEAGRTFYIDAVGFSPAELIVIAESLRAARSGEWFFSAALPESLDTVANSISLNQSVFGDDLTSGKSVCLILEAFSSCGTATGNLFLGWTQSDDATDAVVWGAVLDGLAVRLTVDGVEIPVAVANEASGQYRGFAARTAAADAVFVEILDGTGSVIDTYSPAKQVSAPGAEWPATSPTTP